MREIEMAPKSDRVAILDILRFIAAMMVVLYHYTARHGSSSFPNLSKITEYGYLGVPIFFVISGFVIAMSADNRSAWKFLVSRVTRLYPAYWICLTITILVAITFGNNNFSFYEMLSNYTLLNDYLGIPDVDGVYWTLHAEIKFYACIFFMLLVGMYNKNYIWIPIWMILTATFFMLEQPFFMGWFISPFYSPFFIVGILLYQVRKQGASVLNTCGYIVAGGLCVYMGSVQIDGFVEFVTSYKRVVASVFVFTMLIIFYLIAGGSISIKPAGWVTLLGAITYPLYLLHNSIGTTIIDASASLLGEQLSVLVVVIVMLLSSVFIHKYLEQPLTLFLRSIFKKVGG